MTVVRSRAAVGAEEGDLSTDGRGYRSDAVDGGKFGDILDRNATGVALFHRYPDVDALGGVLEDRIESLLEGVGENERPRDKSRAKHHGENRQRKSHLVCRQVAQGNLAHRRVTYRSHVLRSDEHTSELQSLMRIS